MLAYDWVLAVVAFIVALPLAFVLRPCNAIWSSPTTACVSATRRC
jgi:hypothetical protein